mmetsp:Transcript_8911/g.27850  ORF Transcript_8911/g.27850 Transcript_8911/m.27850 type:complete len:259 (-) Transcript_8911:8-784(-)
MPHQRHGCSGARIGRKVYVAGGDYTAPDGHFCSVFDLEDETWSVLSQRLDPALPSLTQLLGRTVFRNVAFQPVGAVAGRLVVLVEGLLFVFNPLRPSVGWRPASDASDASDLAIKKVLGTAAQGSCVWRDCLVVSRGRGVRGACAVMAFKFSAGPEDDDWHRGVWVAIGCASRTGRIGCDLGVVHDRLYVSGGVDEATHQFDASVVRWRYTYPHLETLFFRPSTAPSLDEQDAFREVGTLPRAMHAHSSITVPLMPRN